MNLSSQWGRFVVIIFLFSSNLFAEHAKVELTVESGGNQVTAFVDQTPPPVGKSPRPVLEVKAGEPVKIQWIFQNVYPNKTLNNVVMHFYVAKAEKVGQRELPDISGDVELETAFDMDFKPGARAGARNRIVLTNPGVYMVRVESRQTDSDHEHFAAIDLIVK
ncbi:MAG: hypothetical protein RJA81_1459 [Planctomycetota bacterium]|jgi:hypothetical protein